MTAFDERRPSPALVTSAMALFAPMGGTGCASTHAGAHHSGKTRKSAGGVTSAQMTKLIAGYLHARGGQLRGPG